MKRLLVISVLLFGASPDSKAQRPSHPAQKALARFEGRQAGSTAGADATPPRIIGITPDPQNWIVNNSGLAQVQIQFNEAVQLPTPPVEWLVARKTDNTNVSGFSTSLDANSNTLTITFDPAIRDERVTLVLDYNVTDAAGNELDGEIANPADPAFPSGDGVRGGQAVFRYHVLQGDANRDGVVDGLDGTLIRDSLGLTVGNPAFNLLADLNLDGSVNALDGAIFRDAQGRSLFPLDGQPPLFVAVSGPHKTGGSDFVIVTLNQEIDDSILRIRDCFLIDAAGNMRIPYAAIPSDNDLYFLFNTPLDFCETYAVNLSNAIADASGELLIRPTQTIYISGATPPAPTLNPHITSTKNPSVTITGTATRAASVEVSGPMGVCIAGPNATQACTTDAQCPSSTCLTTFTVPVTNDSFTVDFLPPRPALLDNRVNAIFFTSLSSCGGIRSAPTRMAITRDNQPPTLFIDFPVDGASITTSVTDVAGRVGDLLSGYLGLVVTIEVLNQTGMVTDTATTTVNEGIGTNGTFFAEGTNTTGPNVSLNLNQDNTIRVTATDQLLNSITKQITVTQAPVPLNTRRMDMFSGNGQKRPIHTVLPDPIVVQLFQEDEITPLVGKWVTFETTRSNGRLGPDAASVTPTETDPDPATGSMKFQMQTDAQGKARAFWRLGDDAGKGNNRVRVTATEIAGTVEFCATAEAGSIKQINIGMGNNQIVEVGAPASEPLVAWVNDACNGNCPVQVTFTVTEGGGQVRGNTSPLPCNADDETVLPNYFTGQSVTVYTSRTGHAEVRFTAGPNQGNNRITASVAGLSTPATFIVYGVKRDPDKSTNFTGLVVDNGMQPIQGAFCELTINGTSVGTTYSDINGQFRFDLADGLSGSAGLTVDGFPATHIGGVPGIDVPIESYPQLHYETVVIPNAENSLPTPVRLPKMDECNRAYYSQGVDTILTIRRRCDSAVTDPTNPNYCPTGPNDCLPAIDGLRFIVKAGSMTIFGQPAPEGSLLMLNQVHHDDIPMPLPDGAAPPMTGTLWPPYAKFDPPIAVEFPNMVGLPPGAIAYFLSFDHDTSRFEIVASGHVIADGSLIVTDPGVGIPHGGWHGNCPPYSVTGDTDRDDDDGPDDEPCFNDRCCQESPCCGSSDPCCGGPNPCCTEGDNPNPNRCCNSDNPCCGNPSPCCGGPNPCCPEGNNPNADPCCNPDNCCEIGSDPCCNSPDPCCDVTCEDDFPCKLAVCNEDGECIETCTGDCAATCGLNMVCLDCACVAGNCSFNVIEEGGCPGGTVEMQLIGSCNPDCGSMSFSMEKTIPYIGVILPGSIPCDGAQYERTVTVTIDDDAPPGPVSFLILGTTSLAECEYRVNMDIVECVDLKFQAVPDAQETDPGGFLCLNDDDDNDDDSPDKDDAGPTLGETDLKSLTLTIQPNWPQTGTVLLNCTSGCDKVKFYENSDRSDPFTPQGWSVPSPDLPKTIYVEGIKPSTALRDVVIEARFTGGGVVCKDVIKLTVVQLDLDADSDNSNAAIDFGPQRDQAEDGIEDKDDLPGRTVWVNNNDDDRDNVADFGDGYNLNAANPNDDANADEKSFVRLVCQISAAVDLAQAQIRVTYDASDPASTSIITVPPNIALAPGNLRIWTKNGNLARNSGVIPTGDYVAPGTYDVSALGFTGTTRTMNLWLEGVRPSSMSGDQRILMELDPDGSGPADFCGDAVRLTVSQLEILAWDTATTSMALADHADIGHWGEDRATNELTGYTAGATGTVINGAANTFVNLDPDRFAVRLTHLPGNAAPAVAETIVVQVGTLTDTGAGDDADHNITLVETGPDTGVFESESQLLTAPDLSAGTVTAANQDDGFAVYSTRTSATVVDEGDNDRTHKATIDGHVRTTYNSPSGPSDLSIPACDRVPTDERKEVRIRVHVFNEPFDDYGFDGILGTLDTGEGGGVFDFTDTNLNGVHDAGEPSEPFTEISGDSPPVRNTVLGSASVATNRVSEELARSNAGWTQVCIRVAQVGGAVFEDAPNNAGGMNILRDGLFSDGPGADEEVVLMAATGATHDTIEVYFISPFVPATGAEGLASTPGLRGGISLPTPHQENTYLFVASSAIVQRRVLAHELGHALTNRGDITTPKYVFFRTLDGTTPDDTVNQQRRLTHQTQTDARTCRTAGSLSGVGNRLLMGCP